MKTRSITISVVALLLILTAIGWIWLGKSAAPLKSAAQPAGNKNVASREKKYNPVSYSGAPKGTALRDCADYRNMSKLPAWLKEIAGLGSAQTYKSRIALVGKLKKDLDRDERLAIYAYIAWGANDENSYAVKNDLLNEMRKQKLPPPELAAAMIDMVYADDLDSVIRIYALQHLRPWFEDNPDPSDRRRIADAYIEFAKNSKSELSGVALLALHSLSESFPDYFNAGTIKDAAASTVASDSSNTLSRTSAIQICANMGCSSSLPAIREIAASSTGSTMKASAIAAIGTLGDESDLRLLSEIEAADPHLKKPDATAREKINQRAKRI